MRTASGELLLVDWDAAGPVNPRHDLANEALVWAGVHRTDPDVATARAFVRRIASQAASMSRSAGLTLPSSYRCGSAGSTSTCAERWANASATHPTAKPASPSSVA